MNSKKVFFIMLAILGVTLAGGFGGFYLTDKALQQQSEKIGSLKADQEIVAQQIDIYEDARKKIEELSYIEDLAKQVLPETKEQAEVIAEIRTFADDAGMSISSIDFQGSSGLSGNLDTSQTNPTSIPGVLVLPVTVVFRTTETSPLYQDFISFLESVEQNRRKMQITELSLTPSGISPDVLSSVTVSIDIYVGGGQVLLIDEEALAEEGAEDSGGGEN